MGSEGIDLGALAHVMQQDIAVGRADANESIQDWIDRNAEWLRSIGYEVDDKGMKFAATPKPVVEEESADG